MPRRLLTALMLTGLLTGTVRAQAAAAPWSYTGATGPEHWGELSAAYETCSTGLQQSPIDLATANAVAGIAVSVDYDDGLAAVHNTGKTIQADFPAGSWLTTSGRVFGLAQVHFHTPSEHTFGGATYPLVAHFVHVADDGALAVLGVLFEEGEPHPELEKILDAVARTPAPPQNVQLTPKALVPDELGVFRYMGSLTTPPCSEGVHWHVAENALTASPQQLRAFEEIMGSNARPVLPVNGRLVVAPE